MPHPILTRLAAAMLPALALAITPAIAQQKPATQDWTRHTTLGPNGAFIVGNPKAPTKLVEYLSYTCSHCANFQATSVPDLKAQWVKRGLVSVEYRNFVQDPFNLTAALLARCGGTARFLGNHEAIFADFQPWMERAQAFGAKQKDAPKPADEVALFTRIADGTGLTTLLAKRGLTPVAQRKCLADKQALATVLALSKSATDTPGFSGTPFFLINGKPQPEAHDLAGLRPLLPPLPPAGK